MNLMYLRAETEGALITALPWFRGRDENGEPVWLSASHHHALDAIGPLELTPSRMRPDGTVEVGDVDTRFHANLLLADTHSDAAAILEAAAPYRISVTTPRRTFA